jgi:hypothetical protein
MGGKAIPHGVYDLYRDELPRFHGDRNYTIRPRHRHDAFRHFLTRANGSVLSVRSARLGLTNQLVANENRRQRPH